jgi:short-chain fatty acids transporter
MTEGVEHPGLAAPEPRRGGLERLAYGFTAWAEKWFPDAFVFVVLTLLAVVAALLVMGAPPLAIANQFGAGFWSLIPFTLQMSMVVIAGYVVATSPPCARLIDRLALVPRSGPQAVAFVALASMASSFFNWALSLVLGGLLARALSRRGDLKMDYRAAGAAAYLGLGATWALGLSSSSAML